MTEGAKETRTCQECGTEYEYIVGSSIGLTEGPYQARVGLEGDAVGLSR